MDNKRTHHQAPQPEVRIYNPLDKETPKLRFDLAHRTTLQSYIFSTSVNDAKGEFQLTFYPDDDNVIYTDEKVADDGKKAVFDRIGIMDIVQIYESEDGNYQKKYSDFTGVIRSKKLVVQMTDGGPRRSVLVTGHSIAGMIQEFRISLDLQAMELTGEIANELQLTTELTIDLIDGKNKPLAIKIIVEKILDHFLKIATKYGKLSNPQTLEMIHKWMGPEFEDIFDVDKSEFYYPIGNIFRGQNTQNFYDVIEGLVPKPIYEIFPYTEENGKTKIKIRCAPFDIDVWNGELEKTKKQIDPVMVKSFDVQQSDNEVYTVYFAYLDGYPIQMDKALTLASQSVKGVPGAVIDEDKFGIYGYRPLYLSLHGYGKSKENDDGTADRITNLSNRLKEWFCKMDKMYTGKITMSTNIEGKKESLVGGESARIPQPGEKILFLGGEFYVTVAQHSWNYGGNPETILSITRGGRYSASEKPVETSTETSEPTRYYTVKDGDKIKKIAESFYGSQSKYILIMNGNPWLDKRPKISPELDDNGQHLPFIYGPVEWSPNGKYIPDVLTLPPDPDKTARKVEKKIEKRTEFHELTDIAKRYQEFKGVVDAWV